MGVPERVNSRNGYRPLEQDTRAGAIELAIPRLRQGSYFPAFLEHRRRAERAVASVVATSYLLGVSTRRVEKVAATLGVTGLSKPQVRAMVADFRSRSADRGPYTFVWIDAPTQKVVRRRLFSAWTYADVGIGGRVRAAQPATPPRPAVACPQRQRCRA